jgi:hypothetical protein
MLPEGHRLPVVLRDQPRLVDGQPAEVLLTATRLHELVEFGTPTSPQPASSTHRGRGLNILVAGATSGGQDHASELFDEACRGASRDRGGRDARPENGGVRTRLAVSAGRAARTHGRACPAGASGRTKLDSAM